MRLFRKSTGENGGSSEFKAVSLSAGPVREGTIADVRTGSTKKSSKKKPTGPVREGTIADVRTGTTKEPAKKKPAGAIRGGIPRTPAGRKTSNTKH